jgi:predicted CoA-substrate-specific enzyme activase
MMHYVCKYTPIELIEAFGEPCELLDDLASDFELSDGILPANVCGFGKALVCDVMAGKVSELVLVNCCDTIRRVYDVLKRNGTCDFLYLMDLPHAAGGCGVETLAHELIRLRDAYARHSGVTFDREHFLASLGSEQAQGGRYVGLLGARIGHEMEDFIAERLGLPVRNLTCTGNRRLSLQGISFDELSDLDDEALFEAYARMLLGQVPCFRMDDTAGRRQLYADPGLAGIIYHTIKFCDFYGFEYARLKSSLDVPLLKVETDYTKQSAGQLSTRIEAFAEALGARGSSNRAQGRGLTMHEGTYVAGIDSGSASTDVVILDREGAIVSSEVVPTGGGAQRSAERSLAQALEKAGIARSDIAYVVATGYGRSFIDDGNESITEITCHARGAHHLDPDVRTIIDIGGQDSKVIRVDESGAVQNFVMNDKCAAGTGRFLEMMARTLDLSLEEMARLGMAWKHDLTISSMCTVFAESEVVSLVAENKAIPDIVHGLNNSVASKVATLVKRVGPEERFMMTGGVARNEGVVRALENRLGTSLAVYDEAQVCGALGAALFARDRWIGE